MLLAHHGQEVLEEVAELGASKSAFEREANEYRRDVQDLQAERDELLARLRSSDSLAANAQDASDLAAHALDAERRRAEEWAQNLSAALQQRNLRFAFAEERAAAAARELARLEAGSAAAGAEASVAARVTATEAEFHRRHAARLEASLHEARDRRLASIARGREEGRELTEAHGEASALEATAQALSAQLADSERHVGETERKALNVARELLDTSQSIARLRSEAEAQQGLCRELEEAQEEEGMLEQQLEAARRGPPAPEPAPGGRAAREPEGGGGPLGGAPALQAPGARGPAAGPGGAELELRSLRASQEQAVSEALRAAWEAEARDRRATEQRLEALQAGWPPLREWLMRLTSVARRWQEEARAGRPARDPAALPAPPPESAWCREQLLPEAAAELCDCLEAIAVEGRRRLSDGPAARARDPAAWQAGSPPDARLGAGGVPSLSLSPTSQGQPLHLSA